MQGGRLKPDEKQAAKPRGGLARWVFDDGTALLLTEAGTEKRAGVWVREGELETQEPIEGLGPDADTVDTASLAAICAAHSMRLHGLLRDQRAIAGIGRRLANETCHRAKLSPFANASKLKADEVERLAEAIHHCIDESLAYERSRDDMSSSKERPGSVHHRAGEPCPVCGDVVREVEYTRYTVNYCATCQTGGKVLADNTTSKFLK
jgi:formamidopyrimidine-DNA glycosylase